MPQEDPGLLASPMPRPHLVQWMAHGQKSQRSHSKDFRDEVATEEVGHAFMDMELSVSHPGLGQSPEPLGVTGQEDGAVGAWVLA